MRERLRGAGREGDGPDLLVRGESRKREGRAALAPRCAVAVARGGLAVVWDEEEKEKEGEAEPRFPRLHPPSRP